MGVISAWNGNHKLGRGVMIQPKHELFPALVSYLSHCEEMSFMVVAMPTFLVRGVPYVVRTYHLRTRLEEGEETIFKEVVNLMHVAWSEYKMIAFHNLAGPYELSGSELHGMAIRYAKVGLEE